MSLPVKRILVKTSENPPVFAIADTISPFPDIEGNVMLTEAIESLDFGTTNIVHYSRCFEYDEFLLEESHRLVNTAMDLLLMTQQLLELRAKPAFDGNEWVDYVDSEIQH